MAPLFKQGYTYSELFQLCLLLSQQIAEML